MSILIIYMINQGLYHDLFIYVYLAGFNAWMFCMKNRPPVVAVNNSGRFMYWPFGTLPMSVMLLDSLSGGSPSRSQVSHWSHPSIPYSFTSGLVRLFEYN